MEMLVPNFQRCFLPGRNISVDETMVGFRGRFGSRQYMPAKPTKYGIKAFTLADSEHGYILNTLVYTGRDTLEDASAQHTTLPQPARVVLDVMEPYLDKGHRVFADRYYTSIPLATALHDRQTDYTGTSMKNRLDLPDQIRDKSFHLTDNQVVAYRSDWLLAMGWRAAQKKKPLITISSNSSSTSLEVQSRRTGRLCIKPQIVNEYNQSMNGVDKADQYTVYYSFIRKSKKWWRKLFFWLLEVTVVRRWPTVWKDITYSTKRVIVPNRRNEDGAC
jgi:hypothetical protein